MLRSPKRSKSSTKNDRQKYFPLSALKTGKAGQRRTKKSKRIAKSHRLPIPQLENSHDISGIHLSRAYGFLFFYSRNKLPLNYPHKEPSIFHDDYQSTNLCTVPSSSKKKKSRCLFSFFSLMHTHTPSFGSARPVIFETRKKKSIGRSIMKDTYEYITSHFEK